MRLKRVKNADELVLESPYVIRGGQDYIGKWSSLFNNDNRLEIEIGMGKGDFIISKALENPNINYIGIEKYSSVLLMATKKLKDKKIPNLRLLWLDAEGINEVFSREVDLIYLNFSDPWPKKRHAKRRLTHKNFLDKYSLIVKDNIEIMQKTDNDDLFAFSKESFIDNGFIIIEENTDYGTNVSNTCKTEYEKKFISLNKNINFIHVIKKQSL